MLDTHKTGRALLARVLYHLTGIACGESIRRVYELLGTFGK